MKRVVFIASLIALIAVVSWAQTGEKTRVYPFKVITYNPTATESTPAATGEYTFTFDPANGDSTTYGIDSLATGLHYDTCDIYFDISDYSQGWLCWGFAAWDSSSADVDSHRVEITAQTGTDICGGTFIAAKSLVMNERGDWRDTDSSTAVVDTLLVTNRTALGDSLFVISLAKQLSGSIDVDSTYVLDRIRLRMVFCDSALVGDANNNGSYTIRAAMLMRHE